MNKGLISKNCKDNYEDEIIFLLMSYQYRVNKLKKIISNPIFNNPMRIKSIRKELVDIMVQLKQNGWSVPELQD